MYSTKEELEKAWPIGTIIGDEEVTQRFFVASDVILDKIRDYFGESKIEKISPHHVLVKRHVYTTIDGYIFDGNDWWPAVRSGRQWQVYYPEVF